ncbi:MAG: 14 kDa subunit of cytochrome bd ubiquinol oxidase [Monoraphidium minutum]|nr:MAG: 14 kDa subunit of cytochrome bd ubiquinol oxidase [Monoraphidium minutum]
MAMARMLQPFVSWAQKRYQAGVAERLKDYGLRYDDLYDPLMDLDIAEALRRLPPDVVVARNQRLKRAMDLSMKSEKLPKALREKQTPFDHYLLPMLQLVKAEKAERHQLGTGTPYQRTIP